MIFDYFLRVGFLTSGNNVDWCFIVQHLYVNMYVWTLKLLVVSLNDFVTPDLATQLQQPCRLKLFSLYQAWTSFILLPADLNCSFGSGLPPTLWHVRAASQTMRLCSACLLSMSPEFRGAAGQDELEPQTDCWFCQSIHIIYTVPFLDDACFVLIDQLYSLFMG